MDARLSFAAYAAAAVAWLLLATLALAAANGRDGLRGGPARGTAGNRWWLALAAAVTVAWAGAMAMAVTTLSPGAGWLSALETCRSGAWLAFLALLPSSGVADATAREPVERARRAALFGTALLCGVALAIDALAPETRYAPAARVLIAIWGLLLIEQVWRNAAPSQRWSAKFLCVAMLAVFGYDLAMYSDALLYGQMDTHWWSARGFANALVVPLVAISASRSKHWRGGLAVSRDVVFHSATLMGAGLYLLAVATIGWWARERGGGWGAVAQAVLLFASLIGLLLVGFSGKVRASLRVTLAKNFFRYRYDYRHEWLRFTDRLSQGSAADAGELQQRVIEAIAAPVESHGGALWLLDDDGHGYDRVVEWNLRGSGYSVPVDAPLPAFMQARQWVVSVPEWRDEPERYGGLVLPDWCTSGDRVWLIVPLVLHERLLGFVALAPSQASIALDWEVTDLLKTLGRQAASYLGQQQAVSALVQARQFDSFNRMSAFVVHDLKNLVAQLSLMMANAERHKHNPEFQADMLSTVDNVLERMRGLLLQLRAGTRPIEAPVPLPAAQVLRAVVTAKRGLKPEPQLVIDDDAAELLIVAHRDRLERVVGHLLQNAAEATPPDGRIAVQLSRAEDGGARIEVRDTGRGMSEGFVRQRLFRPFESTKPHGMGIGAFESREYVRELGGTLLVESREGAGTVFRIALPAFAEQAAVPA